MTCKWPAQVPSLPSHMVPWSPARSDSGAKISSNPCDLLPKKTRKLGDESYSVFEPTPHSQTPEKPYLVLAQAGFSPVLSVPLCSGVLLLKFLLSLLYPCQQSSLLHLTFLFSACRREKAGVEREGVWHAGDVKTAQMTSGHHDGWVGLWARNSPRASQVSPGPHFTVKDPPSPPPPSLSLI